MSKSYTAYTMTEDGCITFAHNGRHAVVDKNHVSYNKILKCIQKSDFSKLDELLDARQVVSTQFGQISFNSFGVPMFMGEEIHGVLGQRLRDCFNKQLPVKSLAAFLTNLQANPSFQSVRELYDFLSHNQFPITEDGCFIGYKGVQTNFKDVHSGKFDNSVGKTISMPRNKVDDNREVHCSYGFHVGTYEYAKNWGPVVVLVKVNPADCVSVPTDHECAKLRVCKYEVVDICKERIDRASYEDVDSYEEDEVEYDEGW